LQLTALESVIALQQDEAALSGMSIIEGIVDQLLADVVPVATKPKTESAVSPAGANYATTLQKRVTGVLNLFNKLSPDQIKALTTAVRQDEATQSQLRRLQQQLDTILK
jgi:hypothetical protein